ncbi:septum formation family protein [Streptomyces sp. NPDC088763]|uniref:septum formation family protein n=1 Tax=Streptomyces sp. NPDC088763 TaxID=3365892 RepID=UPI00382EF2F2
MSIPPPSGPHQPYGPPEQPQGPYPQGPYPQGPSVPRPFPSPYGFPYGPYGGQAPVNGLAIGSLVLGILCFVPAVGLVLGLIALAQIRRKGERGKGMAIAGSVLSAVGLALWALMLSTGAASDFWDGFKGAASGDGSAFALDKGDCFDTPSGNLEGETFEAEKVPCAGAHDGEVFAVVTLTGGRYPGEDELSRTADDKCYALSDGYAMDTWGVPEDVDVYYFIPTPQSWRFGDRELTCLFGSTEKDGRLTGSLRGDATTLDADQVAFLTAVNAVDAVLYEEPQAHPDDDLAANQEWARDVRRVLGEQIAALRGHRWPDGAKKPVTELIGEMEDARAEWGRAAAAKDSDTYFTHYEKGYAYVDGPTTVTAREALGLDTTVPLYEDDSDSGGGSEDAGDLQV